MIAQDGSQGRPFRIRRKPVPGQAHYLEPNSTRNDRPRTRRRDDEDRMVPEYSRDMSLTPPHRPRISLRRRFPNQSQKGPSSVMPEGGSEMPCTPPGVPLQKSRSLRRRKTRRGLGRKSDSPGSNGAAGTNGEEIAGEENEQSEENKENIRVGEVTGSGEGTLVGEESALKHKGQSPNSANEEQTSASKKRESVNTFGSKHAHNPFPSWQWQVPKTELTPPDSNDG